ncbi:hypothetical protein [Streptomyces sp. NPDC007904]|uniref:hypothetical protein n=1 Tax=Streptomyces sp. NPDC007904 TaxID=3364787 RepID=UPI0036E6E34B
MQIPDTADPAAVRLHIGLGSMESLTDTDKKAHFSSKDLLVRPPRGRARPVSRAGPADAFPARRAGVPRRRHA